MVVHLPVATGLSLNAIANAILHDVFSPRRSIPSHADAFCDVGVAAVVFSRFPRLTFLPLSAPERLPRMLPPVTGALVFRPVFWLLGRAASVVRVGCVTQGHRLVRLLSPSWSISFAFGTASTFENPLPYRIYCHSENALGRPASTGSLLRPRDEYLVEHYVLAVVT